MNISRKESSAIRSPCVPGSEIAFPLRKTVSAWACAACQSREVISSPSGVNQAMSVSSSWVPSTGRPWKKRRRRKTGCSRRSRTIARVKRSSVASASLFSLGHRTQDTSLSWQYALLLPPCVRPNSSPWLSIGTPCDSIRVARKLRIWRARSSLIPTSSVSPSAPQFHERLWLSPSRFPSPFASLCFSL